MGLGEQKDLLYILVSFFLSVFFLPERKIFTLAGRVMRKAVT